MANREIRDYATFSGANDEGYLIIGGIEGVEGGKKLLSNIEGSNVPDYPTDVGVGDVNRYELKVHNRTQGGMQVLWDKAPVYAADSHGGLVLRSGQTSYDYAINTNNANNGDVLTYSGDNIVWSAPAGGGGDPFSDIAEWDDEKNPAKKVKDHDTFPLEKNLYIHLKKDNDIIKHRMFFQYGGSGENFYGPWGS